MDETIFQVYIARLEESAIFYKIHKNEVWKRELDKNRKIHVSTFQTMKEKIERYEKLTEELREENERFKRIYENTGAIFNRQHMKDKIERYEKALEEIKSNTKVVNWKQSIKIAREALKS